MCILLVLITWLFSDVLGQFVFGLLDGRKWDLQVASKSQ
jgi:hypothetical protein